MNKTSRKNMKNSIHYKAIRLAEGGIVNVDGHYVKLEKCSSIFDTCNECEMDSLCHCGNEMHEVCKECDNITMSYCFLKLIS